MEAKEITRRGFVQAMNGRELWVNTEDDQTVKFVVKDDKLRNALYCTHVEITIKQIES